MIGTAAALAWLLLPVSAAAQTLTGGVFEMRAHGVGPVSQGDFAVPGGSITFTSGARAFFADYPLMEGGGKAIMPTPGGLLRYLHLQDNQVSEGSFRVTIPNAAVADDFDFFVNPDPASFPLRANPASIASANARLSQTGGPQATVVPSSIVEFNLLSETGVFFDANLARPAMISLPYADLDGNGIVDGTTVRVGTLAIYVLDESRALWVHMPSGSVDRAFRIVTAPTSHFSVYALIGVADQVVDNVHAFPVPWAPNSGNALDGTREGGITFDGLPSEGTINIHTLAGQLVRSLPIPAGALQLRWDGKTSGGRDVVGGVYIWRVQSGPNSKLGKLVVIR